MCLRDGAEVSRGAFKVLQLFQLIYQMIFTPLIFVLPIIVAGILIYGLGLNRSINFIIDDQFWSEHAIFTDDVHH